MSEIKWIYFTFVIAEGVTENADMGIGWIDENMQLHFEVKTDHDWSILIHLSS